MRSARGRTKAPVAAPAGFAASQSITVGTGADQEAATIAQVQGGRDGARLIVAALNVAHAAGHRRPAAASRWRHRSRGIIPVAAGADRGSADARRAERVLHPAPARP